MLTKTEKINRAVRRTAQNTANLLRSAEAFVAPGNDPVLVSAWATEQRRERLMLSALAYAQSLRALIRISAR